MRLDDLSCSERIFSFFSLLGLGQFRYALRGAVVKSKVQEAT